MNKSIKLIFNYLLAPALFIILSWSLYNQIIKQQDLQIRWDQIKEVWHKSVFWIVFLLMIVNWGIEARKWQILLSPLENQSFLRAFKAVLAGCSVTMLTPNRIGEYGGRIIYVKEENRISAVSLTIMGSISQLLITMIMGITGFVFLKHYTPSGLLFGTGISEILSEFLLYLSIGFTLVLILIYLRIDAIVSKLERVKFFKIFVKHLKVLHVFSGKQLLRILYLSLLRYMVFILQYVLLLNLLEVNVSMIMSFWLLTIFYLVMAIAPTIGFIELPVRAAASVEIFRLFSTNILGIQAAALGIWLINLVLPAILGSLLIFGIKILREK